MYSGIYHRLLKWNNVDFEKVAQENIEKLKERYPERHARIIKAWAMSQVLKKEVRTK